MIVGVHNKQRVQESFSHRDTIDGVLRRFANQLKVDAGSISLLHQGTRLDRQATVKVVHRQWWRGVVWWDDSLISGPTWPHALQSLRSPVCLCRTLSKLQVTPLTCTLFLRAIARHDTSLPRVKHPLPCLVKRICSCSARPVAVWSLGDRCFGAPPAGRSADSHVTVTCPTADNV